jgi:hypothetical protein
MAFLSAEANPHDTTRPAAVAVALPFLVSGGDIS